MTKTGNLRGAMGLLAALAACGGGPAPAPRQRSALTARLASSRFRVAEEMRASREMQLSGEPFAQLLNYNLMGFNRRLPTTDQYCAGGACPDAGVYRTDPLGYALAVESYEYSRQPMNNVSFESGAGLALEHGPVLNPAQQVGAPAFERLRDRFQRFAIEANAGGPLLGKHLVATPPPQRNPFNSLGWPGLWPVYAPFSSFDPAIAPDPGLVASCSLDGSMGSFSYGGAPPPGRVDLFADYECNYLSLNLPHRDAQVEKTLQPEALGELVWKQGLWVINYWQSLQDSAGNAITEVAAADRAKVGQPGNAVVGRYPDPTDPTGLRLLPGAAGVYLGDIPMEGWQGLTLVEEIDNQAELLLTQLESADGVALHAAPLRAALDYGYASPLLYFPASVAVTEAPTTIAPVQTLMYFPRATGFSIADGHSSLAGLSGLIGGYGEAFAFTDPSNPQVGGSLPFELTFDGDPFPKDDGLPDGEATLHDRALGILKIALVDLDRLHFDPGLHVLVDAVAISGGQGMRGTRVDTAGLAEAILALRNASRALDGSLQLYSNDTPDTHGGPSALDAAPLLGGPPGVRLADRVTQLIRAEADFLSSRLVAADGSVANGYDLAAQAPLPGPTSLEAETGALRALLEAYLATSDERYRLRAVAVYQDLGRRFWIPDLRLYRTIAGDDRLSYTPLRFGLLTGALRQYYKLVAGRPGSEAQGRELLLRLGRSSKLILNGWDDVDGDGRVEAPEECLEARLEMGERMLTGEVGHRGVNSPLAFFRKDGPDRDHDCVPEISAVGLPAALAGELELRRR